MTPPLSATQIDTARDCLRKFGFAYFTDLPKPEPGPGAELGSKVHAVAEAYLKDAIAPDRNTPEGEIFIGGLPYLPPPGSGGVEGRINFEVSGVSFTGFVDLRTRGSVLPKWDFGPCPIVLDHKTSSDPKKWGLTTDTLPCNVQALIYGMYELEKTGREAIGFRWLYYKTKGRGLVYPVDVLLTVPDIVVGFNEHVWSTAELIHGLWQTKPDPNTLEARPESCSKYGGCPYQGVCKLTPAEKAAGLMRLAQTKEDKVTPMQRLRDQINAGQNPGINPPVPGVTQAPVPQQPNFVPPPAQAPIPPGPPPTFGVPTTNIAPVSNQSPPSVQPVQTTIAPFPATNPAAVASMPLQDGFDARYRVAIAAALLTRHDYSPAQLRKKADEIVEALLK